MGDFEKFYNIAIRFLSYRPRSEKEVRDYLVRHSGKDSGLSRGRLQNLLATKRNIRDSGHGQNDDRESIIDNVIAKLKEQRFVNDEEFAKRWVEQRSKFKPQGIRLTELELRQKGIDKELIDRLIHNSEFIIQNDLEQAKRLVEKKIGRFRNKFGMTRERIYQKLGRYLASKGFSWDTIKQSIDEVILKGV